MIVLRPFETGNEAHRAAAAAIWNAACGPDLAISPAAVRFNTFGISGAAPAAGAVQAGRVAVVEAEGAASESEAIGFVLASAFPAGDPAVSPRGMGWVDAVAVRPACRHRGGGSALLTWAEGWLAEQGYSRFRLGGSLRPFVAGLPVALGTEDFFRNRGYADRPEGKHVWDVARSLRDYAPPTGVDEGLASEMRALRPNETGELLAFLWREFPGRWRFEFEQFLAGGGRLSDYLVLLTERGIEGFCQLTFEDSLRPMDRYFMHRLPRPWGQLGPIGVGQERRGQGYGAVLLDAGLRRLRDAGIDGCVIDWTDLLEFYGKFGFEPYRQYVMLVKEAE